MRWWIFAGLAGGMLAAPTWVAVALPQTGFSGGTALASDINDDGFLDLIATGLDRDLVVQMGQGDGTFATLPAQDLGAAPRRCRALATGHLDEDGHLDLFTGNWIAGSGSVLYGDGAGVFQLEYGYGSDGWPSEVALGDLDGNGRLDAVVANETRSDVTILLDYQIQTASAPRPTGGRPALAFTRVWPVPAHGGALHAMVALPARGEVRLDLLDVAGRSVAGRPLGVIGAGTQQVSLDLPGDLRPGVYWLRLSNGGHAATARVAVLR